MAFQNVLRQIHELTQGPGCFASAGRGLGNTLRSVEDYVSEVINRGVCYIDNTLEDNDEQFTVGQGRASQRSSQDLDDDATKNLLPGPRMREEEAEVRHRAGKDASADDVASCEVWDIRASSSYGSLACAPLVDVEASADDFYKLSADSSAVPTSPNSGHMYAGPAEQPRYGRTHEQTYELRGMDGHTENVATLDISQ